MEENLLPLAVFAILSSLSILFIIAILLKDSNYRSEKQLKKWDNAAKLEDITTSSTYEDSLSQEAKNEIRILEDLKDEGIMSQREFEEQKSKVIEKSKKQSQS